MSLVILNDLLKTSSYHMITVKLANGAKTQMAIRMPDESESEDAQAQYGLKPAPGNCNNPELLMMTHTLHMLFKLMHNKFTDIMEKDFEFMKGFIFHPQFKKRYEDHVQEQLKSMLKQICREIRQSKTMQPDKIAKVMGMLNQLKNFPSLKHELKQEVEQTMQKLKLLEQRQQLQMQKQLQHATQRPVPNSKLRPEPKPEPEKTIDDEISPSMRRILNPMLRPY